MLSEEVGFVDHGGALSRCCKTGRRGDNSGTWLKLVDTAERVRILSTSCLEAMLVADGATGAFASAGSDTTGSSTLLPRW